MNNRLLIARNAIKEAMNRKQSVMETFEGVMGDGDGTVQVPGAGNENLSYVRINDTIHEILNTRMPLQEGLRVIVGYDPTQPDLLQVLSTRTATPFGESGRSVNYFAPAGVYMWGGTDTIFIDKRQLLNRKIASIASTDPAYDPLSVRFYTDTFLTAAGAWITLAQEDIDMSGYIPATADKAVWVLITIDSTGDLILTEGSEVDTVSISISDIPEPPSGSYDTLAAVLMYDGQTAIVEEVDGGDILDLRFSGGATRSSWEIQQYISDHLETYTTYGRYTAARAVMLKQVIIYYYTGDSSTTDWVIYKGAAVLDSWSTAYTDAYLLITKTLDEVLTAGDIIYVDTDATVAGIYAGPTTITFVLEEV